MCYIFLKKPQYRAPNKNNDIVVEATMVKNGAWIYDFGEKNPIQWMSLSESKHSKRDGENVLKRQKSVETKKEPVMVMRFEKPQLRKSWTNS